MKDNPILDLFKRQEDYEQLPYDVPMEEEEDEYELNPEILKAFTDIKNVNYKDSPVALQYYAAAAQNNPDYAQMLGDIHNYYRISSQRLDPMLKLFENYAKNKTKVNSGGTSLADKMAYADYLHNLRDKSSKLRFDQQLAILDKKQKNSSDNIDRMSAIFSNSNKTNTNTAKNDSKNPTVNEIMNDSIEDSDIYDY